MDRQFRHWFHDVHMKPCGDLPSLLGWWDNDSMWDVISLWELVGAYGDGEVQGGDECTLLRGVGRGQHGVLLGPWIHGAFRVAVAVHHRWIRSIGATAAAQGGRSVAVTIQPPRRRPLQILSGHMPSSIGHSSDDFEFHLGAMMIITRGTRRSTVLLGIDANTRLHTPEANIIGSALIPRASSSASSSLTPCENKTSTMIATEFMTCGFKICNTFENCWPAPRRPQAQRHTWSGKSFGRDT